MSNKHVNHRVKEKKLAPYKQIWVEHGRKSKAGVHYTFYKPMIVKQ